MTMIINFFSLLIPWSGCWFLSPQFSMQLQCSSKLILIFKCIFGVSVCCRYSLIYIVSTIQISCIFHYHQDQHRSHAITLMCLFRTPWYLVYWFFWRFQPGLTICIPFLISSSLLSSISSLFYRSVQLNVIVFISLFR